MTRYPVYIRISCFYPCDSLHRGGVCHCHSASCGSPTPPPSAFPPCSCLLHELSFLLYLSLGSGYSVAHLLDLCIYNDVFRFFSFFLHWKIFFVVFVSSLGFCLFSVVFMKLNTAHSGLSGGNDKGRFWQMRMKNLQVRRPTAYLGREAEQR